MKLSSPLTYKQPFKQPQLHREREDSSIEKVGLIGDFSPINDSLLLLSQLPPLLSAIPRFGRTKVGVL